MPYPTPFDDVNSTLLDLNARIRTILGGQFVGLYLYGSLALGDFDPQASDIDFIVVTRSELPSQLFQALQAMHAAFERSGSAWAGRVEAAYIPLDALRQPAPQTTPYPQIEKGTPLLLAPLEAGWAFQRCTLRQRGVVVTGPAPLTFTGPVDMAEMRRAAAAILGGWQAQALHDPDWIAWVRERCCQAFVVLTVCRLLYSLETGSVASKPKAARWAQESLGPRRAALIRRALASQHDKDAISDLELADTLDFIDEAAERARDKG